MDAQMNITRWSSSEPISTVLPGIGADELVGTSTLGQELPGPRTQSC